MPSVCAHLIISGRVQGVCFRICTEQEALRLKLTGWVRNLPTGQVETYLEGEEEKVEKMIEWCHQGPPAAKVKTVEVLWEKPKNFSDFSIV
ncbi:MAG: acylphosphatase [Deltaproteobacteria bacterium]|nr:acylphosphatase [Deltaproteobacteria bacterium]